MKLATTYRINVQLQCIGPGLLDFGASPDIELETLEIMAGADVTMMCSILLRRGIGHIAVIEREMLQWMGEHEYESVEQLKGA
jgi:hypothetical protein